AHTRETQLAERRLVAGDAAERRRARDRSRGLRAERERDHAIGDRRRRAARRSAWRARRIVRIARLAWPEARELGRHRLAEHDRAGSARRRNAGGVPVRTAAAIDRRAESGRHVEGVEEVLHRDRHPEERAGRRRTIGFLRLRKRLLAREVLPRSDLALTKVDARKARTDERLGSQPSVANLRGGGAGIEFVR